MHRRPLPPSIHQRVSYWFTGFLSTAVDHRLLWPRFSLCLSPQHSHRRLPGLIVVSRDHTVAHRPPLFASSAKAHHLSRPFHPRRPSSPFADHQYTRRSVELRFRKKKNSFSKLNFRNSEIPFVEGTCHSVTANTIIRATQRWPTSTSAYMGHYRRPLQYALSMARRYRTTGHCRVIASPDEPFVHAIRRVLCSKKTSASTHAEFPFPFFLSSFFPPLVIRAFARLSAIRTPRSRRIDFRSRPYVIFGVNKYSIVQAPQIIFGALRRSQFWSEEFTNTRVAPAVLAFGHATRSVIVENQTMIDKNFPIRGNAIFIIF